MTTDGNTTPRSTAIVVGAGVGGVAIAARLAQAGYEVTVLEKNDFTGGRCSLIHEQGYRFDQGPSLLLLPELFRETFADLGTSLEKEDIHLLRCDPNYEVHFDDGEKITLSSDLCVMKDQIERWEGKDGFERYLGFLQEAHRHYEVSVEHVLHKNFYSLFHLARPSFLRYIITLHPFESIYYRATQYFKTERMRRVFTFSSMYMGMSPYEAPGTYSLLQYAELVRAIWYPVGGFHKVVEALVRIGERAGVSMRLSSPVASVTTTPDGKRATGVVLKSGEALAADVVVLNADLVYAYNNLLPPSPQAKQLSTRKASCSSISFYWAIDRVLPQLKTHNIFLAGDYRASFDAIFERQSMPDEPSFYVNVPSRVDPTAAPEGKDSIIVLVPIGHLQENGEHKADGGVLGARVTDWDAKVKSAREIIVRTIEARTGIKGLNEMIIHESVNTPITWREKFNLDRGGILGLSHSFFNVLSFRPSTQHPTIDNCYFVGASTHPGTGVPICLAGARVTAEQILSKAKRKAPWPRYNPDVRRPTASKLDVLQPTYNYSQICITTLVVLISISIAAYRL